MRTFSSLASSQKSATRMPDVFEAQPLSNGPQTLKKQKFLSGSISFKNILDLGMQAADSGLSSSDLISDVVK